MSTSSTNDQETPLSAGQYYAIVTTMAISSILSAIGSSVIIMASRKNQRTSVYQRHILALSGADALSSLTLLVHPFLLPADTKLYGVAAGNSQSCQAMGFFFTLGKSMVSVYSASISLFFLLKVRYNRNDKFFSSWLFWRGPIHFLAIVGPAVLGLTAVLRQAYAPRMFIKLCTMGDCEVGKAEICPAENNFDVNVILAWVAAAWVVFPALVAVGGNILLYYTVRARIRKNRRYVFDGADTEPNQHLQAVKNQAILYTLSYLNSILWITVVGVLAGNHDIEQTEGKTGLFTLQLLASLFYPMQGLFNFLVYSRPRYLHWRLVVPEKGKLFAFLKTLSLEPVSPTAHLQAKQLMNPCSGSAKISTTYLTTRGSSRMQTLRPDSPQDISTSHTCTEMNATHDDSERRDIQDETLQNVMDAENAEHFGLSATAP